MNISILESDIKQNILNIIEKNLLLITFHGNREPYLMKGVRDNNGKAYVSGEFCEHILVNNEDDITSYIRKRLKHYAETGEDNIFNSVYKSCYCNQFLDTDYHIFLQNVLQKDKYNWLYVFRNLNLSCWDKGSKFHINIEPFNKIMII